MSKYFQTRREPVSVTARGKTHVFYVRELGYLQLMEILRSSALEASALGGLEVAERLVLATVEAEDGSPAYTKEEWRAEVKEVVEEITQAVKRVQALDGEPDEKAADEGNA